MAVGEVQADSGPNTQEVSTVARDVPSEEFCTMAGTWCATMCGLEGVPSCAARLAKQQRAAGGLDGDAFDVEQYAADMVAREVSPQIVNHTTVDTTTGRRVDVTETIEGCPSIKNPFARVANSWFARREILGAIKGYHDRERIRQEKTSNPE
ncbi:hypothetical protein FWG95_01300 [Candidatus Saccharibacteria bacterium]|nr:hypothetical protein [Candidatus Saccharibacteria bacterium]